MNDYSPLIAKHRQILLQNGVEIDRIVAIRQDIHKHPEGGFKEFRTQKVIRDAILSFGIEEEHVKKCAQTGLVVDLIGLGDPIGEPRVIALRADIDALKMAEENFHLEYRSTTDHAHMCGHDGHTAMLLCAAQIFHNNLASLPSNKTIRLLFQPAEEGPGGAKPMIAEGCLEGVDEVFGCH